MGFLNVQTRGSLGLLGISTTLGQSSCPGVVDQHIIESTVFLYAFIWLQFGGAFAYLFCFGGIFFLVWEGGFVVFIFQERN